MGNRPHCDNGGGDGLSHPPTHREFYVKAFCDANQDGKMGPDEDYYYAAAGSVIEVQVFVLKVGMTAYRPTTEGPAYGIPFDKHEVPEDLEETPGAGIRVNGDTEANENDLIEVELKAEPYPTPSGLTYVLKRQNSNIKVWDSQTMGTAILDSGTEATITFSAATKTVWVENPAGGSADLEFIARAGTTDICSDKVHFYPFSSVVVFFEGEFGVPSDPPASGISGLALAAYTNGYDVHLYDEPDIFQSPNYVTRSRDKQRNAGEGEIA